MSARRAMKIAVVEYVSAHLGWDKLQCAIVGSGGKPRPDCGDWFLGVWGAKRQYISRTSTECKMSVNLTVSMRFGGPIDRWDGALDEMEIGFDERIDSLAAFLFDKQNEIRARADELVPINGAGFVEAPSPTVDEEPIQCGAEWWNARGGRGEGDGLVYGFRSTVVYGGWTFIQSIPNAKV